MLSKYIAQGFLIPVGKVGRFLTIIQLKYNMYKFQKIFISNTSFFYYNSITLGLVGFECSKFLFPISEFPSSKSI